MKTVYFILVLLFGLMFINSGLDKIFHYIPMPDNLPEEMMKKMAAMMEIGWLLPLVAFAEIVGGILVIVPKTRALGAIVLFPIMIGILLSHLTFAPDGLPIALVLVLIHLTVLYNSRKKLMGLIG